MAKHRHVIIFFVEQCDVRSERDTPYSTDVDVVMTLKAVSSSFSYIILNRLPRLSSAMPGYRRLLTGIITGYAP